MKSIINTKNTIIIILCITIILLGIGFSYVCMQLDYQNKKKPSFDLKIKRVEQLTPIQGGDKKPTGIYNVSNSGKTINLEFNLYAPRDEISYKIIIKNEGTIKASIINLIEIPDYINDESYSKNIYPIKISHNDIVGKVLEPDEEIELNVVAYFSYKAKPINKKAIYQISILAEQADK